MATANRADRVKHPNRARRKANERRRFVAARNQAVLPIEEQKARAEAKRAAQLEAYPVPPNYRPAHDARQPDQPWCYLTWWERERAVKGEKNKAA